MRKIVLTFGLIAGAVMSAMFLILFLAILLNWTLNSIERRLYEHG